MSSSGSSLSEARSCVNDEDAESGERQSHPKKGAIGIKRKFKLKRKKSAGSSKKKSKDVAATATSSSMDAFFRDVESVEANIAEISEATRRIGALNDSAALATTDAREAEISGEVRPLVDETNKVAKRTKDLLASMKEYGSVKPNEKKGKMKQSDLQIRNNLCHTLTRKFVDELKRYQAVQQKYKSDMKNKARRQIRIIHPDATDEEIDIVVTNEGGREGLYKKAILADGVSTSIKTAYLQVADKYRDIVIIEQSVAEIHQMFLDLALLTEQQGELHDQIEHQVKSAADNTEEGAKETWKALKLQKKIRKKQCLIIVVVGVIVAVITVILLL